jgi:putative ABC transport system substrate-binding protein
MRRREFIAFSMGAVLGWPLGARAQQAAFPVIGFLSGASFEAMHDYVSVFKQSLADAGFVEGRNVAIEYRWADGRNDRLPELAADLVRREVAVIVVGASTARRRRKQSRLYSLSVLIQSKWVSSRVSRILAATLPASPRSMSN